MRCILRLESVVFSASCEIRFILIIRLRSTPVTLSTMFDIALRPMKDRLFDPLCNAIPRSITPLHLTIVAFLAGVGSCTAAAFAAPAWAVSLWIVNRTLDCLDGAVARRRNQESDLGGFLDLLGDFIIYSTIPICCATAASLDSDASSMQRLWLTVATTEATFHVNNFVLFYIAAVAEKQKVSQNEAVVKDLTSVMMRPALVEGAESGLVFTVMLAQPEWTEVLCCILSVGVAIGTMQRVRWVVQALSKTSPRHKA